MAHTMKDGSEKPICYISRTLSDAECNYAYIKKKGWRWFLPLKSCISICMGIVSQYSRTTNHCWDFLQNINLFPLLLLSEFNTGLSSQQHTTITG